MKFVLLVAVALTFSTPTMAEESLSEHFKELDGSCWAYTLPDGATDTRCFHIATGNQLAINTHKLVNKDGSVAQEGVTAVRLDPKTGIIDDTYYNSGGAIYSGTEKRVGDEILFYDPGAAEPTATWIISSTSYQVVHPDSAQVYIKTPADN
ncbi:MAG: hypothetical protein NVV72_15510 [Asticcacaulis sp.]|nr:hypothetical protein [Asticcacaulis sp.]